VAGQRDFDLDMLMVRTGEGSGCLLASAIAAVMGRPGLVPVGRDRDDAASGPRHERANAAGGQSSGDREISCLDFRLVHEREGARGLDTFGER
jgi:hypothetical protein